MKLEFVFENCEVCELTSKNKCTARVNKNKLILFFINPENCKVSFGFNEDTSIMNLLERLNKYEDISKVIVYTDNGFELSNMSVWSGKQDEINEYQKLSRSKGIYKLKFKLQLST